MLANFILIALFNLWKIDQVSSKLDRTIEDAQRGRAANNINSDALISFAIPLNHDLLRVLIVTFLGCYIHSMCVRLCNMKDQSR